jgi:hypothetical protein
MLGGKKRGYDIKGRFYEELECLFCTCHVKILLEDVAARVGW